jgi:hypothetical protein
MSIKMFFDQWIASTVMYKGGIFTYPDTYTAETLSVFHVDVAKNVTYIVNMNNVYPKVVDDVSLSAQDKSLITFKVLFVYESWDSVQLDMNDSSAEMFQQVGADPNARNTLNLSKSIQIGADPNARNSLNTEKSVQIGADANARNSLNLARNNNRDNLRRAMNLVHLIRAGANKDSIKSAVISIGTRKINNMIGQTGLDQTVANAADRILGAGSGILEKIDGIFR